MRYDFTKVQNAINEAGFTLRDVEKIAGIHYVTVHRALKTGNARQSTALKLTKAFKVSMKDVQVKNGRVA